MIIRKEMQPDVEAISDITKAAFKNNPYSNNTEQFIINSLRAADALTVSLVAEVDGKLVGHIAFSPVTFSDGSESWYGLGPISVEPDYQKQGIGTKLVNKGLGLLKDLGATGCVLVGEPNYYKRFGFRSVKGLKHEGVPQENFLALSFCNRVPKGVVQFHQAFSATE
ncbi:MAG: GNAT family N-acetyltransferase [Planctomycetota bacterium]|jgi:putative acetyltransferase